MREAQTQSLCPVCLRVVDAAYEREGDGVFLCKTCPQHGDFRTPVWRHLPGAPDFAAWRQGARLPAYPAHPATARRAGCPYDCGLCPDHAQHTCTGLIEVTQRCSLVCPVCYANAGGAATPDPDMAHIAAQCDALAAASGACNVQLSGGEPTEREDLPEIIALTRAKGFALVQLNSNGLRLGTQAGYAAHLKAAGLDSVYLQYDGIDDTVYRQLRGRPCLREKNAAIEACATAGLGVVLVCTVVPGVNDHQLGHLLRTALEHGPAVRGLHLQPAAAFGRFPHAATAHAPLTLPELMHMLEAQSGGALKAAHFHAPSCEHPLCSFSAVYGREGNSLSATPLGASCCSGGTGVVPDTPHVMDNADGSRKAKAFVALHWSAPDAAGNAEANAQNDAQHRYCATPATEPAPPPNPLQDSFARFMQQSGAHRRFTVSGMAFQDARHVDIERLRGCCIHVVAPNGRLIPFCAYNLTADDGTPLYRGRDAATRV